MSLIKKLENEIAMEKRILNKCDVIDRPEYSVICKMVRGKPRFLIKKKKERKQKYVRLSDYEVLEKLLKDSLDYETAKVLRSNITALQKALDAVRDYDADSILEKMKPAYRKLRDALEKTEHMIVQEKSEIADDAWISKEKGKDSIPQSENPKDRSGLKFRTSFRLMVRSKNELLIAEALYAAGLKFRYEKRLELVSEHAGRYNSDTLYPDFTVLLPDGEVIYWEHMGMWDNDEYKEDNIRKMTLYFQNGIYPPKNLILTFDGKEMPFDNGATWRLIEGMILSRC